MKKAILVPKGQYSKGTYKIKGGGEFDGYTVWDFQKNGVVADIKTAGYKVFEQDWEFSIKANNFIKILRKI